MKCHYCGDACTGFACEPCETEHDPGLDEMREYLLGAGLAEKGWIDTCEGDEPYDGLELDAEIAIYWFAADYHGGQNSRLYEALCESPYSPGLFEEGIADPDNEGAQLCYAALESRYNPSREIAPGVVKA